MPATTTPQWIRYVTKYLKQIRNNNKFGNHINSIYVTYFRTFSLKECKHGRLF